MSKFYITTPIYYINDKPHIGHTYPTIAADVLARYHRQLGDEVLFGVGVDENSQKTVESATKTGQTDVNAYAATMSKIWRDTWDKLDISYGDFIRTTEERHVAAVHSFLELVIAKNDIYKGTYEGLYCVGCEEFKRPEDLVDGKCPLHDRVPDKLKEDNYFFKLSAYGQQLEELIASDNIQIRPASRRNEVLQFIRRGLEDISVSRAGKTWGIPWPNDPSQVIYVWFDALLNYLTIAGYPDAAYTNWWPADLHVVGKDITKFHCIIWPAMLLSAGLPVPKTIVGHGFFTVDGKKISKSLGNAIDPLTLTRQYGNDALRYYLLREIPFGADGNFSHERFAEIYNTELANDLGNLVQRTVNMSERFLRNDLSKVPGPSHDEAAYRTALDEYQFDKALANVWELVRGTNQLIDAEKPWELAKSDTKQLEWVLGQVVANVRHIGRLLGPFLPDTSDKIAKALGGDKTDASVGILFPKHSKKTDKQ